MRKPKPSEPMTLLRCETCGRESLNPTRYVQALGWLYCPKCPKLPGEVVRGPGGVPTGLRLRQPVSRMYPVMQQEEATP